MLAVRRSGRDTQLCLIRRKGSQAWGIPKGFIDPGDTAEEAALTEALEEAGLEGDIVGHSIGTYEYEKRGDDYTVAVYVMRVLHQQRRWPEVSFRERKWWPLPDAIARLAKHPVRPLLNRLPRARV